MVGSGVFVVQMKDVSRTGIRWDGCSQTRLAGKRNPDWLRPGDIIFQARGNQNYAALVDESLGDRQAVAVPHFFVVTCTTEKVLPSFMAWFLNQGPCQRYFQREAEGSQVKSIRRSVLEAVEIAIPAIEKQQSIVRLAQLFDKEQELMEQMRSNTEQMMNALAFDLMN